MMGPRLSVGVGTGQPADTAHQESLWRGGKGRGCAKPLLASAYLSGENGG